jgi:hypothetical protein
MLDTKWQSIRREMCKTGLMLHPVNKKRITGMIRSELSIMQAQKPIKEDTDGASN